MKTKLLFLLLFLAIAVSVRSQEQSAPAPVVTAARILGPIPDGTPPPPAPPKPEFIVPAKDVLTTTTHQQDGRTITIRQIKPIDLPPPPPSGAGVPPAAPVDSAFSERLAEYRASHPKSGLLFLGATVFRFKDSPPRTLVRYWPEGTRETITFWSSADVALIAGGINSFMDSAGDSNHLLMGWGNVELDHATDLQGTLASRHGASDLPDFPEENATYQIVGAQPAPEDLIPIQSLHDLYNSEFHRLKAAYEGREQARLQREAYLKSHAPQPKNITLNYWRTEKPAAGKGGSK